MKQPKKCTAAFFQRPTLVVAQDLLGKYLVVKQRNAVVSGKIVETEAYSGEDDLACHASKGRTPRTETLYAEAGTLYVYLVYGMHHCVNIITEAKDFPSAVLIRAVEPAEGVHIMERRRKTNHVHALASGPGKVCEAFGITKRMNGKTVFGDTIWIEDRGVRVRKSDVVAAPRVGVEYAGACARYPWRFYIKGNKFISKK